MTVLQGLSSPFMSTPTAPFCSTAATWPGGSRQLWPLQASLYADHVQRPNLLPGPALSALHEWLPHEKLEGITLCFYFVILIKKQNHPANVTTFPLFCSKSTCLSCVYYLVLLAVSNNKIIFRKTNRRMDSQLLVCVSLTSSPACSSVTSWPPLGDLRKQLNASDPSCYQSHFL